MIKPLSFPLHFSPSLSCYPNTLFHISTYTCSHTHILSSCPLLLCYNIFDWTFPWGIPGALWTRVTAVWSHTHTGERSLITVRWLCVCTPAYVVCMCMCVRVIFGWLAVVVSMECGKMWLARIWLATKRCSILGLAQFEPEYCTEILLHFSFSCDATLLLNLQRDTYSTICVVQFPYEWVGSFWWIKNIQRRELSTIPERTTQSIHFSEPNTYSATSVVWFTNYSPEPILFSD